MLPNGALHAFFPALNGALIWWVAGVGRAAVLARKAVRAVALAGDAVRAVEAGRVATLPVLLQLARRAGPALRAHALTYSSNPY